jgi:hypothetical protein
MQNVAGGVVRIAQMVHAHWRRSAAHHSRPDAGRYSCEGRAADSPHLAKALKSEDNSGAGSRNMCLNR